MDLMFEAFAACLVVADLIAAAEVQAVIEFVTSTAAAAAVILTVDPGLATKWRQLAGLAAAVEPWIVVACGLGAD